MPPNYYHRERCKINIIKERLHMLTIILNILLPPLAVYMHHGVGQDLLINILLTIIGWIPGVIHAFLVN